MSGGHQPVLLTEVLRYLAVPTVRRIVDGTVGMGGHSAALLRQLPDSELLGMDRDEAALTVAAEVLHPFGERVHLVQCRFSGMADAVRNVGWPTVDAILLDLGVSSPQIDTPSRGFSFRFEGPLDMRMDRRDRITAAVAVNTWTEEELTRVFREFGEEPQARRVARAIVARRGVRPWAHTTELAELVEQIVGRHGSRGLPAATRCFQALRIAVNDELGELEQGLSASVELLRPGGRMAVIAFHSLEDRRAKQFIRHEALSCVCPPDCPVCVCGKAARLKPLTHKPIMASAEEVAGNPRAASARLRVAERVDRQAVRVAGTPR